VQRRRVTLSEVAGGLRPSALRGLVTVRRDRLSNLSARLTLRPIRREITTRHERIAALSDRLEAAGGHRLDRLRQELDARARLLSSLSYKATLERGYAVVRSGEEVVTSAKTARAASALTIEFRDGEITAVPTDAPDTPPAPATPRKASKPKPPPEQGSLF